MKKEFCVILMICLASAMLCACGGAAVKLEPSPAPSVEIPADPEPSATAVPAEETPALPSQKPSEETAGAAEVERPAGEASVTILASEGWNNAGYTYFQCEKSGTYQFVPSPCEDIIWRIYILDELFPDGLRYLGQAHSYDLEGAGSLAIGEGQYVYVYCSVNSFTGEEADESMYLSVYAEE